MVHPGVGQMKPIIGVWAAIPVENGATLAPVRLDPPEKRERRCRAPQATCSHRFVPTICIDDEMVHDGRNGPRLTVWISGLRSSNMPRMLGSLNKSLIWFGQHYMPRILQISSIAVRKLPEIQSQQREGGGGSMQENREAKEKKQME
eukprot:6212244-Pleurochrysis_carterae.AAC.1